VQRDKSNESTASTGIHPSNVVITTGQGQVPTFVGVLTARLITLLSGAQFWTGKTRRKTKHRDIADVDMVDVRISYIFLLLVFGSNP
jgi:hypothetical protein